MISIFPLFFLNRSVLKVIKSLHEAGRSPNGFVVDDIVMVDNDPKFIGIELQDLNRNTLNQDYESVIRLIDRIYGRFDIPRELNRLKDDLSNWRYFSIELKIIEVLFVGYAHNAIIFFNYKYVGKPLGTKMFCFL